MRDILIYSVITIAILIGAILAGAFYSVNHLPPEPTELQNFYVDYQELKIKVGVLSLRVNRIEAQAEKPSALVLTEETP